MNQHQPVMIEEVRQFLLTEPNGIYVDGTFGRGGHAQMILHYLNDHGRLIAFDRDPDAVESAAHLLGDKRFCIYHLPFSALYTTLKAQGLEGKVQGILLDLGVSSPQLDNAARGFSFMQDGPLDMRMDTTSGITARDWLATVDERTLMTVLREYGEERYALKIARAIVAARKITPIVTTRQLAKIVSDAHPSHEKHKHPATRTFQAIRIFINRELDELSEALSHCIELLKTGGRLAVISFHSLEDRIVKRFLQHETKGDDFPPGLPVRESQLNKRLRFITRALKPSANEVAHNPRARSAHLRIAEKIV